ncbi:MAG: divalent-cation tolerance protein CutA [Acidobacteriaceae bacterium]|nr:divalent-cation tolerance protein CutA [Acidobacteriaceae bacterium]
MTDSMVVLCTCGNVGEAERIAAALVEERFAACVNILPPIRSLYRWKGNVETAEEMPLLIKTTGERFPALQQRILQLHSYEVPEIIALPIVAGLEKYLVWLREQV